MKPTLFDVMESDNHWEDMKGDHANDICDEVKRFLNDIPGTFYPDSVWRLRSAYSSLESFIERLEKIAKPYAEDLAEQLAADGHIGAQIREGKE